MSRRLSIQGKTIEARIGESLFRLGLNAGVFIPSSCGGQGKCRECLVEIEAGAGDLSPRASQEKPLQEGFRLACRARIVGSAEPSIACHTLARGRLRIVEATEGLEADAPPLDPAVVRSGVVAKRRGEVLGDAPSRLLGLAVDLGTTTIALRLCDLETGEVVALNTLENPQRFAGSDVMARIAFDGLHRGRLLQRTLLAYLGRAIDALPCECDEIFEVVIVGNTTMRDLFFGLDVQSIGQDPYRSLTEQEWLAGKRATTGLERSARRLGLPVHPRASVIGLPLVASHLGADAAAALLATGVGLGTGIGVLMDIGTNTELVMGNQERIIAASCPAGPAFEGGGLGCGMPGVDGAIERVRCTPKGTFEFGVIGDVSPLGICGSGLVELLAELVRTGRMNRLGRFQDEADEDGMVLDEVAGIMFSESDVNELAQAKGANAAGVRVLLDTYGIDAGTIERFYLAGGFARHLDPDAARRIGLVPDLPDTKLIRVGNAALEGAQRALLSVTAREELEQRVRRVEHVRLETHPLFFDAFVEGCQFHPFR